MPSRRRYSEGRFDYEARRRFLAARNICVSRNDHCTAHAPGKLAMHRTTHDAENVGHLPPPPPLPPEIANASTTQIFGYFDTLVAGIPFHWLLCADLWNAMTTCRHRMFFLCLHMYCFVTLAKNVQVNYIDVGGSVAEWLACRTQAHKGLGSNRSRNAVG